MKASEGTQAPAVAAKKRGRKFDVLMSKHGRGGLVDIIREARSPGYQEKVDELVRRGEAITPEHLGYLGKALLEKDLIKPPKDPRARLQAARTALEAASLIGPHAAEQHLHLHQSFPPVVQQMLLSKMKELAALQQTPERPASVTDVTPPEQGEKADAVDIFGLQDGGR